MRLWHGWRKPRIWEMIIPSWIVGSIAFTSGPLILAEFEQSELVYTSPYRVSNEPIPGAPLRYTVVRCNNSDRTIPVSVIRAMRSVEGGPTYTLGESKSIVPPGCSYQSTTATSIPIDAMPGMYVIEGVVIYEGRWRTFHLPSTTEPFKVARPVIPQPE